MIDHNKIIGNAVDIRRPKKIRGIYFLIYKKKIIYIGSGFDIRTRIEEHIQNKKKRFDSYYILKRDLKRLQLAREEAQYIQHYKPIHNRTSNPDYHEGKKPIWFKYLTVEPNIAEISRSLNIPFQIVNGIILEKRKKKDEYYYSVTEYLNNV